MQKKNKTMSVVTAMLIAAAVILANPVWGIADIFPDLLAWVLVWFALRIFAELNENMTSARRMALYLMGISVLKLFMLQPVQNSQIRSDSMLATLVFCLVEAGCMLLFFRAFFKGAEELARVTDCDAMYLKIENVHFLCSLFVVTRAVCTLVPELTAIPDWLVQYGEMTDETLYAVMQEFAGAKELLNVICTVPVLLVAAVWLVSFLPFVRLFGKDRGFVSFFNEYAETDNPQKRVQRRFSYLHMARICFAVGLVFAADLQIDAYRILPICIFPVFFAAGCLFLEKLAGKRCFRSTFFLALASSVALLLGELYRRFCTVWDLRVYAEVEFDKEILLSVFALVGMGLLFCFWLSFAWGMDTLSSSLGCGKLYLHGFPYVLLVALGVMQSVIFILPLTAGIFNFVRLAFFAALWLVTNRRLAAFEERVQEAISLGAPKREID